MFGELLQDELRGRGLEVTGKSEIEAVLGLDKLRSGFGCDDATCLAEIGGALGVDELIHGAIAKMTEPPAVQATPSELEHPALRAS